MIHFPGRLWLIILAGLSVSASVSAQEAKAEPQLAERGVKLLETYCHRCHGADFKYPGLDVTDRAGLLRPKDASEAPFVVPGKPDESRLWQIVVKHDPQQMPPESQPQPSAAEGELLRAWIASGFAFPDSQRPARAFLGEETLLAIIAADLDQQPREKLPNLRYFSLAHLWNDRKLSDDELRLVRAAVSKLMNSLSRKPRISRPRLVDPDGVVLAIDLGDYGWTARHWLRLLEPNPEAKYAGYPYGLQRGDDVARRVYDRTHCELPYVRADWFVRNAARPPLYHDLLGLPNHSGTFELARGVNVRKNFDGDRLWRAGMTGEKSGVSDHNRIVERHDGDIGYLWSSYDAGSDSDRANFFRFPLGPEFPGVKNPAAFLHDGGEFFARLPNGLQEYLLAKANGERIDEGPANIVKDPNEFSGAFAVVNGISCMGCHKRGIVPFTDAVRDQFTKLSGQAVANKVQRLYPARDEMQKLIDADTQSFLKALEESVGPFVRTGSNDTRPMESFAEPITRVARGYDRVVSLATVARELGLPELPADATARGVPHAGELATLIKNVEVFRRLNLGPLGAGETLPRDVWEQAFQRTAQQLKLGVPVSF